MVIIRLVILVKKDSFRGFINWDILMFLPLSASICLDFPFFTMLSIKIFATNINKPYTIIETQMRVLGMFFLCLGTCVIKLQINLPLLYSKGIPIKCTIVSPLPPLL